MRHGEVNNPGGVLYERLPNFGLTERGAALARSALDLVDLDSVSALVVSPLQRARESMHPWEAATGLIATVDERVIEPWNEFRGIRLDGGRAFLTNPRLLRFVTNPFRPSWGEPYNDIAARMIAAMGDAADAAPGGDVVIVSHQLPIWTAHLAIEGKRLWHNPKIRRCSLSSVTSFRVTPTGFVEEEYREPADAGRAMDSGAV